MCELRRRKERVQVTSIGELSTCIQHFYPAMKMTIG